MKTRLLFLFLIIVALRSPAQRLWDLQLGVQDYVNLGRDTIASTLRQSILSNDPFQRSSAMRFLAIRGGESERSFLVDSLRVSASTDDPFFDWDRYYTYQLICGYYGVGSAISGLDTVARFGRPISMRIRAEYWLVSAQHYDHFDLVMNALSSDFVRTQAIGILAEYAKEPSHRAEVINLLFGMVRDSAYGESLKSAISGLAGIDRSLLVTLLTQRFEASQGKDREWFFRQLNEYDPQAQPERTIWVVPREQNGVSRSNYFPTYVQIAEDSFYSTRYLELPYVKFASDWLGIEQSNLVRRQLSDFLLDFKPCRPAAGMSVNAMLDTLESYLYEVASLGWLADANFVNELDNGLENAKKHLAKGDSVNAYKEVQAFQDKVNKEYEKTVDDQKKRKSRDKRFVTIEGWKFLYYNAQYIMDRLPSRKKK